MENQEGFKVEKVLPYEQQGGKKEQIVRMFDAISDNYDPMNRFMTFGIDTIWRKNAILSLKNFAPKTILDVATGTGDFAINAFRLLQPDKIVGIDISEGMLKVGEVKVAAPEFQSKIELKVGDSTNLEFKNESFDAATVAFGVRNFEDLEKGISEMCRVLKPGGHLVILEMSEPEQFPIRELYRLYSKTVIPTFARLFSKDRKAYTYLPKSIEAFPQGKVMTELLKKCGFSSVVYKKYTLGVCAFYLAEK
ncbi:MAG: bifunctional demethylmenaquinone methyltransferase/2-methoxy-6-polyprenyl-1,4-benzoquinol methylase UbiE [Bacteroidales bacterium]|nr:bifunctional demethylmenaquinone methyltransferase/2-methoxy-6-polyprenyl-1,4-benzoquinol methylase UbiE [Bacteroidales bacterium]